MQAYEFEIEYVKGKKNIVTHPFDSILVITIDWKAKLMIEYVKNDFASKIIDGLIFDKTFRVRDGLIYTRTRFS